jgi:predicted SAM-dependent methyltransferase
MRLDKAGLRRYLEEEIFPSPFAFGIFRWELRCLVTRLISRVSPWRILARKRLSKRRDLYVNVGCGPFVLDGFVNLDVSSFGLDIFPWDCRRTLPFSSGSAKGVRAEHFFEHLEPRVEAPSFLRECHRILAPMGILRIVVPDAGRFLQAYCEGEDRAFTSLGFEQGLPHDLPTPMDLVSHVFLQYDEHRHGYDARNLARRLESAGFVDVRESGFGQSADPLLGLDRPEHRPYSLFVECRKP